MNIKSVRFYQAIYIGNAQHTHVHAENSKGIKLSWLEGVGVRVETKDDASIVPFANLAYIQVSPEAPAKAKATKGA